MIFALDCTVLARLVTTYCHHQTIVGVTGHVLGRALLVTIPFLAIEQLIASILIAPKHQSSPPDTSSSTAVLGLKLYLGGLGVQEIIVIYVSVITILLYKKVRNEAMDLRAKTTGISNQLSNKWRSTFYSLIFSLATINTRIAYRLVELSGIFTGYLQVLMHNEIYFYALECLPVLAALGVWTVVGFEDVVDRRTTSVAAYTYHEISGETAEDEGTQLEIADVRV